MSKAGYIEYRGFLNPGETAFLPAPLQYYFSSNNGKHTGILRGPIHANFDIRVFWAAPGSPWNQLNVDNNGTSEESFTFNGGSQFFHGWQVYSVSGKGNFQFCLSHPG